MPRRIDLRYNLSKSFWIGENEMPRFGEILCELREDKKLTQVQLAKELHMAPTTISSYETGKIQPPPDKLIYLADYFNVTTDYLLGRSKYDIDPSVFNRTICGTKTLGNLVDDLMALSPKQKEAAMILISDMRFRADYNARAKYSEED